MAILKTYAHENPLTSLALFFTIYAFLKLICTPGMFLLTMVGGALFGANALPLTMLASTLGSSLCFCVVRMFFKDVVRSQWQERISKINNSMSKSGFRFVLMLRLIPLIPYYLINILLPVTKIHFRSFVLGTLIGMIPIHALYTYAGFEFSQITSAKDIVSPKIVLTLCLLASMPLLVKFLESKLRKMPPRN